MPFRVFIIEDDPEYAALLRLQLRKLEDAEVRHFRQGEAALEHLDEAPDLVFLDIVMPGQGGVETLRQIKARAPRLPVVMVSGQTNVDVALEAMRLGAADYVTKGHDDTVKVRVIASRAAERAEMVREIEHLRELLPARQGLENVIGESAPMARVFKLVQKTLRGDLTVAIQGESGTGKELIAQAIHYNSPRRRGPFVVVNCAAIPRELMESEFFGHEKGSFTGAHARKIGKFEQAHGGTLFLDEIGEMSLDLQSKLLRALQNREIQRVGGNETIRFDARILCATNRDIREMVQEGGFREDLYYRLFQFPIQLPPLREREQDVLLLAEHFRRAFTQQHPDIEARPFSSAVRRLLVVYQWPGNVRELKNAVERALLISETPELIPPDLLLEVQVTISRPADVIPSPQEVSEALPSPVAALEAAGDLDDIVPLEEVKQRAALQAYRLCGGNIEKTASKLGVARSTVYRLLSKAERLT